MSRRFYLKLAVAVWLGGLVHSMTLTALTLNLPYCGPNAIDNFFCNVPLVLQLACTDTYVFEVLIVSNSGLQLRGLLCGAGGILHSHPHLPEEPFLRGESLSTLHLRHPPDGGDAFPGPLHLHLPQASQEPGRRQGGLGVLHGRHPAA
ncbi:unnamed protein product [Lepidochelys kempii]